MLSNYIEAKSLVLIKIEILIKKRISNQFLDFQQDVHQHFHDHVQYQILELFQQNHIYHECARVLVLIHVLGIC